MTTDRERRELVEELREYRTPLGTRPAVCGRAAAHIDRMHSWDGLMTLLDEVYPETVFPTVPDRPDRDPGARIVSLLRQIHAIRTEETS